MTLTHASQQDKSAVIHIGALFDCEHPSINNGRQDLQAAQMAVEEINRRQHDLFQANYTLALLSNNSRVDATVALTAGHPLSSVAL